MMKFYVKWNGKEEEYLVGPVASFQTLEEAITDAQERFPNEWEIVVMNEGFEEVVASSNDN